MLILVEELGFKIHTVQTDNGRVFINDREVTKKETIFEQTLKHLNIHYKNIRPHYLGRMGRLNGVIVKIKKDSMISEALNQLRICTSSTEDT